MQMLHLGYGLSSCGAWVCWDAVEAPSVGTFSGFRWVVREVKELLAGDRSY